MHRLKDVRLAANQFLRNASRLFEAGSISEESDDSSEEDEVKRDLAEIQEVQVLEQLQDLHRQLAARRLERKEQYARQEHEKKEETEMSPEVQQWGTFLEEKNRKVIFCAVHKPVRIEKAHGVDQYAYRKSVGGLSSAAEALQRYGFRVRWISWPGSCHDSSSRDGVRQKLDESYKTRAVFLERELENNFYVKFCHGILWPLFHCIPSPGLSDAAGIGSRSGKSEPQRRGFRSASDQFEAYQRTNQLFLEAVAEEYEPGDFVVVYDYHLMLLPALLRKRFPEIACAFFCHCPFPSSEFYRMLPAREDLLRGALGADLVSFNHFDFVRHFLNACMRVLGLEASKSRLEYNGRLVAVSICPAGINPDDYLDLYAPASSQEVIDSQEMNANILSPQPLSSSIVNSTTMTTTTTIEEHFNETKDTLTHNNPQVLLAPGPESEGELQSDFDEEHDDERAEDMARRLRNGVFRHRKIIVCVASLDMSKGIPQALLAMDALLTAKPEWVGIATLVLAARDLGGPHNRQLRTAVDGLVGHVNGKFGKADYCPVLYVKHTLKRQAILALYSMADVALVASVRQGLNTPALEFVACQSAAISSSETKKLFDVGVLVYSEFAGSASSFEDGALLVNPYDADAVARALHRALTMPRTAKHLKHHHLARYINTYTADLWIRRLLRELKLARQKASEYTRLLPLDVARLRSFYERSKKRLLVLEHGALSKTWQLEGWPSFSPALQNCLAAICADPANTVYVLSGQTREKLDEVKVMELGLVAEFGFWLKRPQLNLLLSQEDNSTHFEEANHHNNAALSSSSSWERTVVNPVDLNWIQELLPILEAFTRQTPGAVLQVHESSMLWQYRDADFDFGASQAKDLQLHLDVVARDRPVRIVPLPLKQCIVLQPSSVSKGRAIRAALGPVGGFDAFDLVFAVGDERADDDIFDALDNSSHAFTCTLGRRLSRAAYFLDHDEVIPTLQTLAAVSTNLNGTTPASPSGHIASPPSLTPGGGSIPLERKKFLIPAEDHLLPPPAVFLQQQQQQQQQQHKNTPVTSSFATVAHPPTDFSIREEDSAEEILQAAGGRTPNESSPPPPPVEDT